LDIIFDKRFDFGYDFWIRTRFTFGCVWIRLDLFGYVWIRLDTLIVVECCTYDGFTQLLDTSMYPE